MKAIIEDPNNAFFFQKLQEVNYSKERLTKLRQDIATRIRSAYRFGLGRKSFWVTEFPNKYTHLVYYVEHNSVAHIYVNGYLMTEEEFDRDVAMNPAVGLVGAFHRPVRF